MDNLSPKWRKFLQHLMSTLFFIGMLAGINLLVSPGSWWFIWPALALGLGVAMHFQRALFSLPEDEALPDETESEQDATPPAPPRSRDKLASQTLQGYLEKAQIYQKQIDGLIKTKAGTDNNIRLQDLAKRVAAWSQVVIELARRVDNFQQNTVIHHDLAVVPRSIEELKSRLAAEADPVIRDELTHTLTNRQNQWMSLTHLQNTMERAELKMESTLSSLGTIYSQMLTGQSTDYVADYSRLAAEADEEVKALQDYLEALTEVRLGKN